METYAGAMIGSIICFRVGDDLGRRRELLVAAVLFLTGSIVEAASAWSMWSGNWGLVVLMIGRVAYGIGCGFAMHGVSRVDACIHSLVGCFVCCQVPL